LAHQELAKTLEALNDNDNAMREYERTVELAPGLEEAHYNLGMLAGRAGRLGEGFFHLGVAFALRGEFDKALSQFKKAEPLFPAGSEHAQTVRTEISELSTYLKHGRLR
jgi:tetratricopeptide (TPR) repeat protein